MKLEKIICSVLSIAFLCFTLACDNTSNTNAKETPQENTAVAKDGKEYTSAYICPMHCKGSGSTTTGKCPVCDMAYVANPKLKQKQHDHSGHNHDGHDHSGHNH